MGTFDTDSDWNKGTGWTIGGGKASRTAQASSSQLDASNTTLTVGNIYKCVMTVSNVSNGAVRFQTGIIGSTLYDSDGTYTEYIEAQGTSFSIKGNADFVGSIDNISVVEVDQVPADFDFSRGSNLAATRINEQGLIEKGRENLLLQSNNFDTSPWTGSSTIFTSGQSGYDGSNDAWLLTHPLSTNSTYQSNTNSGVQTFSIYAKSDGSTGIRLYAFGDANANAYFDLNNGVVRGPSNVINSDIVSVGNGWYRCSITFNQTNTTLRIYTTNNVTTPAAGSVYIQDAQLEQGLVATDYIESGATTGKAGVLEDLPRLNWGDCPSLLLEPSRQNLIAKSEYVVGQNVTITYNDITSPEGVVNAAKFVENTSTNTHNIFISSVIPTNASAVDYTVSVFVKKKEREYIQMQFYADSTTYNSTAFDLSNGTTSGDSSTHKIEDYGNGWYRCSFTASVTNSTGGYNFVRANIGQSINSFYYTGNGTSGLYYYGFQLEEGSYATSYIPTHGTSVTRSTDTIMQQKI